MFWHWKRQDTFTNISNIMSKRWRVRKEAAEGYEALGNLEKTYTPFEDAGKSAESCFQFETGGPII